ncbi:MAG: DUF368 domain-containing protein [Ruminococcus sp.]|nr:DUF368 domain-containing protein [Ruminococcus sp.]
MALADSVPGVSGGTIAFIMGIYDEFIGSIDGLITGNKQERIKSLKFMVKLGIGWIIGFIAAVLVLSSVFESHIYVISSLFLGFIIFAIPIIVREEKETIKASRWWQLIFLILGIAIVAFITYFNPASGDGGIQTDSFSVALGVYSLVCGAIAVSAMVLPGISGSTLMLIFGLYVSIISGIKDLLSFDFHAVPMLLCFGIGVIIGFVTIVKIIKKSLVRFRPQTIYLVLGMMIGSLYAIVMGPTTLDTPQEMLSLDKVTLSCVAAFIIGGIVILALQLLKRLINKQDNAN